MNTTDVRLQALRLAAAADCDPRTAQKALVQGVAAVRGRAGERIATKMRELGLEPRAAN